METTKVKLTQKQLDTLDSKIYACILNKVSSMHDLEDGVYFSDEEEIEIDGTLYYINYSASYRSEWHSSDDYDTPGWSDEHCSYCIDSMCYVDEDDNEVPVESGRENFYDF